VRDNLSAMQRSSPERKQLSEMARCLTCITNCPVYVPVIVLLRPDANNATANNVGATLH